MLNIRLARTGRKRDAHFRVVVSDSVQGRVGNIVETVGFYHPRLPNDAEGRLHIDAERARYWIGNGAKPSPTVKSFLKQVFAEPTSAHVQPKRAPVVKPPASKAAEPEPAPVEVSEPEAPAPEAAASAPAEATPEAEAAPAAEEAADDSSEESTDESASEKSDAETS